MVLVFNTAAAVVLHQEVWEEAVEPLARLLAVADVDSSGAFAVDADLLAEALASIFSNIRALTQNTVTCFVPIFVALICRLGPASFVQRVFPTRQRKVLSKALWQNIRSGTKQSGDKALIQALGSGLRRGNLTRVINQIRARRGGCAGDVNQLALRLLGLRDLLEPQASSHELAQVRSVVQSLRREVRQLQHLTPMHRRRGLKVKPRWLKRMQHGKTIEVRKYLPDDPKTGWKKASPVKPKIGDTMCFLAEGAVWGSAVLSQIRKYTTVREFEADGPRHHVTKGNCPSSGETSYGDIMGALKKKPLYGWVFEDFHWHARQERPKCKGQRSEMVFHSSLLPHSALR